MSSVCTAEVYSVYMYPGLLRPAFHHKRNFYLHSVYFDLMFLGRRRGQKILDLRLEAQGLPEMWACPHFCFDVVLVCYCFSQIRDCLCTVWGSRVSSVGTELRVGRPGNRGSMSGRAGDLCHLQNTHTGFGAYRTRGPLVPGSRSPEVKRRGREANYSTPYSAEVKNECSLTTTPPYVVMVCTRKPLPLFSRRVIVVVLVNHR